VSPEPIAYLERLGSYYRGLGYGAPYEWARFADVPFAPLKKPLGEARLALVTTAAPFRPECGDQGPGAPYNAAAKYYSVYGGETTADPDLRISHVAIDRRHTTAEDQASYFPLKALRRAVARGRVGALTRHFFGLPTNRSQRATLDVDCAELLARCESDGADAAILVPNCPVCHQSVALAARTLEERGIATAIMGCARDIVEHVGVPRFLFSDFPLGNSAGKPRDEASQDETLALALDLLAGATGPRATRQSSQVWSADHGWKRDYCNIALLSAEEIARRRAAFDEGKAIAAGLRREAALTPPGATGPLAPRWR